MAGLKLSSDRSKINGLSKVFKKRANNMLGKIKFFAFSAMIMISAQPLCAEVIPGFGSSGNAPIRINAEELSVDRKAGHAIFSGQVEAVQSGQKLQARHMNVIYDPDKNDIRFLYASGDVRFTGRRQSGAATPRAQSELAEYNIATRKLILSGKVVLKRGAHIIKGQSLVIDLVTGQSIMDSTQKGLPGRVRGLFKRPKKPKHE